MTAVNRQDVRAYQVQLGTDTYAVISMPVYDDEAAAALTLAERDIAQCILLGLTNEQIAVKRGSCLATVKKQIGLIFAKLAVDSRTRLVQKLVPAHNDRY